ncbi:MAG: ORF6N domain-containing protein [Bdellovibrionota bacterium]
MKSEIIRSVESYIYLIRGQKVILDEDLAILYAVKTKALVQAVKRNLDRFPEDFMFHLSNQEVTALRSQIVTSKSRGGRRTNPYAFTEQGVAMLSSVLRSNEAVKVNIEIMRTFVRLRRMINSNTELAQKLNELEKKYDSQFNVVFEAIREIMKPSNPPKKRRIGFGSDVSNK